jgi:UDP-glucose 4-epimerase
MSAGLKRVLILGASGFLGRALHQEWSREGGLEVIGHSSKTLDLTRAEALDALRDVAGPDAAVVLASALTPEKGQTPATLMANLAMAANLARFLEASPVGQCVYVSSDAVYGFDVDPVTETTPVAPAGYYALGKYASEKIMEYVSAARGFPLLVLRIAGVYGPGDTHSAYGPNAFARSLARDRSIRLFGGGEERRDHVYVGDVARLTASLVGAGATGVVNVATGQSRSFADVVDLVRDLVPYEITVTSAPRKGPITHRSYDTARLREAAPGFQFTPLRDGLQATLTAFGAF